jgi:hypothetical protein
MTGLQIALLILGGIIFIISFFLPSGKKKKDKEDDVTVMTQDQIKFMVEKEIDDAKSHINEIVDETITYAMEKGERAMDRITNEKMMAVNEYSDTVLKEINKNQQEVVFLYDMLNDKHATLLETVSQVNAAANEVKQVKPVMPAIGAEASLPANAAEESIAFSPFVAPQVAVDGQRILVDNPATAEIGGFEGAAFNGESFGNGFGSVDAETASLRSVDVQLSGTSTDLRNNNERILEMHKEGKSNMSIARTLGLGIGEVKLVIDLFEG